MILLLATMPLTAHAGDLSLGFGAAVSADLGDNVSDGDTRFGPGPSLQVPIRYALADKAWIRATVRADAGWGTDRVTWGQTVDGEEVRFYSTGHWAMLLGTALTVGGDAGLPGNLPLYVGAEAGPAWVTTYHSLGGETQLLLDPSQNDLDSSKNLDPFTAQAALLTDLHAGALVPMSDGMKLWVETGYSLAFIAPRALNKTPEALDARREAYGWNALRLGLGVSLAL